MSEFRNIPTPGSDAWDDNVPTAADLPLINNQIGDKRQALDTEAIYSWNGIGWTLIASPAAATAITALIGDVTATGPGAANTTLKTVNLNVGSFGTESNVPTISVNGKGLVTAASQQSIQIAQSQVTGLVDSLAGKFNNPTGTIDDYIAGNGSILPFPTISGGGGVNYYLNGSVSQGVIGGKTYYQMSTTPIIGTGVDFNLTNSSSTVSFLTNPNLPGITKIPAGNWNLEMYASMSSNGGSPTMTARVYKYDGSTFTLISTSLPEVVTGGTAIDLYSFSIAIPETSLLATDQIAYSITAGGLSGRTLTLHTQDSHLCEILTNIPVGISSINGLTLANQFLTTGTSGTDFNISSLLATHTFNLPTSSSSVRGALSSADWITFNNKLSKGIKTIFCIDNGDYATLQDAVNAASAGDTILVGAKSGGWGNVTIPDNLVGKKLSIVGLQAARCPFVRVGAITFSPTLETQLTENELYLQNLYITSSTSACVTFGGNKGARIRIDGCFIDAGSTMNAVAFNNTVSTSSAYIYNTLVQSASGTIMVSSTPYVRIWRSSMENSGTILLSQTAGFLESNDVNWSGARVGEIINISGTSNFICGKSIIVNTTTNGSGVLLTGATAIIANSNNTWQIATGTGYCIRGNGVHLYGAYLTANSVALAYNVKIQNTVTQIPYTLTFTPTP